MISAQSLLLSTTVLNDTCRLSLVGLRSHSEVALSCSSCAATTGRVIILPLLIIRLFSPASLRRYNSSRNFLFASLSLAVRSGEI